jgi:serine/threonine protein kinase
MALAAGTRLGQYEIVAPLGAGGMGEVYRARDARLKREVAVKVMPADVASDKERLQRFEAEAQAASVLSHPGILAVHDFGTHEGLTYLVTELLEGETLRTRLQSGTLPVRKAIEIGVQVAQGLAAAHGKGILHRDLKPENLFLTRDGHVKIIDFGLAKIMAPLGGALATGATVEAGIKTEPGAVLGTIRYMAPEQLRGQAVDARADLFSFGAVLYEMIAGRPPFAGASSIETATAVLKEEPPPLAKTGRELPPGVELIVRRCLEKHADDRYQSARDLAFQLQALPQMTASAASLMTGPLPSDRSRSLFLPILAGGAALLAFGVVAGRMSAPRTAATPGSMPSSAPTPPTYTRLTYQPCFIDNARFAANAADVIYTVDPADPEGGIYSLQSGEINPVPASAPQASLAAVSVKGDVAELLGHSTLPTLAVGRAGDESPRAVTTEVVAADYAPDGITLAVVQRDQKDRIEMPIGTTLWTDPDGSISDLRVSPRGDAVAFMEHPISGDSRGTVEVLRIGEIRPQVLAGPYMDETGLAWRADGNEIWYTAGTTHRIIHAVSLAGADRVVADVPGDIDLQDISPGGNALVLQRSFRMGLAGHFPHRHDNDLSWFDGSTLDALSTDGSKVLFTEGGASITVDDQAPGQDQIYVRATNGDPATHLGEGDAYDLSPDGQWVLAAQPGPYTRLVLLPTGVGSPRFLPSGPVTEYRSGSFAEGGHAIVFEGKDASGWGTFRQDVSPPGKEGVPAELGGPGTTFDGIAVHPMVSPDGNSVLAMSQDHLVVLPIEGGTPRSLRLAGFPVLGWTADAKAVYLLSGDGGSLSVSREDLETQQLRNVDVVMPPNASAVTGAMITPDGQWYAYSYAESSSTLYEVTGLR